MESNGDSMVPPIRSRRLGGVAAAYGELGASPYLLPLSVDGLVVVASICLVELGGRIADRRQ